MVAAAALASWLSGRQPPGGRVRVLFRERADGVRPELQALLDAWDAEGTHEVLIPAWPPGGVRTQEQQQRLFAQGWSGAASVEDSAHGSARAAVDVWPVDFLPYVYGAWEAVPQAVRERFRTFGLFAEARGLEWGGRWRTTALPNGDQPHVQLRGWRRLIKGGAR